MRKSGSAALRIDLDLPDDVVTGITAGELRDLTSKAVSQAQEIFALKAELEAARLDHCTFCSDKTGRWGTAERKSRKNGKLIRWQHRFDGDGDNTAQCISWPSREREFQRQKKKAN